MYQSTKSAFRAIISNGFLYVFMIMWKVVLRQHLRLLPLSKGSGFGATKKRKDLIYEKSTSLSDIGV